jgi:hypothetical protein
LFLIDVGFLSLVKILQISFGEKRRIHLARISHQ